MPLTPMSNTGLATRWAKVRGKAVRANISPPTTPSLNAQLWGAPRSTATSALLLVSQPPLPLALNVERKTGGRSPQRLRHSLSERLPPPEHRALMSDSGPRKKSPTASTPSRFRASMLCQDSIGFESQHSTKIYLIPSLNALSSLFQVSSRINASSSLPVLMEQKGSYPKAKVLSRAQSSRSLSSALDLVGTVPDWTEGPLGELGPIRPLSLSNSRGKLIQRSQTSRHI